MYLDGRGDEGGAGLGYQLQHLVSSLTVAVYVGLGGLRSAIYNEVLQFVLIWAGALLVPILGLIEAGGWNKMAPGSQAIMGVRTTFTCGAILDISMPTRWGCIGRALSLGWDS